MRRTRSGGTSVGATYCELRFTDIPRGVEEMLRQHTPCEPGSIDEVLALDEEIRHRTEEWMKTR